MANRGKYMVGIRLLLEKQYLETNAGRNRYVKRSELEAFLKEKGYPVEKKTIYADFAVLETVFGLQLEYDPHKKGYRLLNPPFEPHELRLMIDCVQSAPFITEEEALSVTTKIRRLAPHSERPSLERYVEVQDRITRSEESILKNVDIIHTALYKRRKICFQYFDYGANEDGGRLYYCGDKGSGYFTVSPRKLLVKDNCYTLEHYKKKHTPSDSDDEVCYYVPWSFDVSRMEDITILDSPIEVVDISWYEKMWKDFAGDSFGKKYPITVRFRNDYMNIVRKVYGNDLFITPVDDFHFKTVFLDQDDYRFVFKLMEHGCYAKVLAPESAVDLMKEMLGEMVELYETDTEPLGILSNAELNRV